LIQVACDEVGGVSGHIRRAGCDGILEVVLLVDVADDDGAWRALLDLRCRAEIAVDLHDARMAVGDDAIHDLRIAESLDGDAELAWALKRGKRAPRNGRRLG